VIEAWGHGSGKFASAVEAAGARIDGVGRRGKYLVAPLDDGRELVVHLGMTGQLRLRPGETDPYVRAWWALDDGEVLELRDVRRFGRVAVVEAGYAALPTSPPSARSLGPARRRLWRRLRASRIRVNSCCRNDRSPGSATSRDGPSGAGVHPGRRTVTRAEAARLLVAVRGCSNRASPAGARRCDYRAVDAAPGAASSSSLLRPSRVPVPPLRRQAAPQRSTAAAPHTA
jgi:formamidopyrimidine-DNA glycosylase